MTEIAATLSPSLLPPKRLTDNELANISANNKTTVSTSMEYPEKKWSNVEELTKMIN